MRHNRLCRGPEDVGRILRPRLSRRQPDLPRAWSNGRSLVHSWQTEVR